MADIRLLGTVYIRNKPVPLGKNVGRYKANAPIAIGDTVSGMECRWIMVNGLLVAERAVLTRIHFVRLSERKLTTGIEINIDGVPYLCRMLKTGMGENGQPSEWDQLKEAILPVWEKRDSIFSMQEGIVSIKDGNCHPVSYAYALCSWYPVLQPLSSFILTEAAIGKSLLVSVGNGVVSGMLESLSDYDLVMSKVIANKVTPEQVRLLSGGRMVIMRDAVWGIQEK